MDFPPTFKVERKPGVSHQEEGLVRVPTARVEGRSVDWQASERHVNQSCIA